MYEAHFGFDRSPFKITPDTSLFYTGGHRGDILGALIYAVHRGEGMIKVVNESMFGALRLVSVEQGYDPRDFSLVGFGGAGPLHANALGILTDAWPVIIPPGPGVLCAYGDATTQVQDEATRTYITMAEEINEWYKWCEHCNNILQ